MSYAKEIKNEILAAVPISAVAGTRSTRMRCPFHGSESLDMQLFHEDNRWKCWGKCDETGNVFDWIMNEQGIDFKAAFHQLAEFAGIPVTPNLERAAVLSEAQRYFHQSLNDRPDVRAYLAQRGFGDEHLFRRQIGWAEGSDFPPDIPIRKLEQVGLLRNRGNGPFGYFYDRIIYPVYDRNLNQLQMQGRSFPTKDPKYLALPQEVEIPGRSIWTCLAGEEILEQRHVKEVWLTEGWPDRETLSAWGQPALGLFGHSGLEKHSYKLDKLERVHLILDPDEASQGQLLDKLYHLAVKIPHVEFVIVLLPDNQDLNDWARVGRGAHEPLSPDRDAARIEELLALRDQSPLFVERLIREWKKPHQIELIARLVARMPDRERWVHRLATQLGESVQSIEFLIRVLGAG